MLQIVQYTVFAVMLPDSMLVAHEASSSVQWAAAASILPASGQRMGTSKLAFHAQLVLRPMLFKPTVLKTTKASEEYRPLPFWLPKL